MAETEARSLAPSQENTHKLPLKKSLSISSQTKSQNLATAILSQTTRVNNSALISWPNITPQDTSTKMKGHPHYIAETLANFLLSSSSVRTTIIEYIGNYDRSYYDCHVPRIFTSFIQNLVLESSHILEISQRHNNKPQSVKFWRRIFRRPSPQERYEIRELAIFKSRRLSLPEMLQMIWEFRAPIFDQPKADSEGKDYWASNVEGVKNSKAWEILEEELRGLRRGFVDIEAMGEGKLPCDAA